MGEKTPRERCMSARGILPGTILLCLAAQPAGAEATSLDVKTGLWRMETLVDMGNAAALPESVLAAMPPEQQAQLRAQFEAMRAKPRQGQKCITAADIARGLMPRDPPGAHCTSTMLTQTARLEEVKQVCTASASGDAASNSTATIRVEAVDNETLNGSGKFDGMMGGQPHAGSMTIHGKWISATCGDAAPHE